MAKLKCWSKSGNKWLNKSRREVVKIGKKNLDMMKEEGALIGLLFLPKDRNLANKYMRKHDKC